MAGHSHRSSLKGNHKAFKSKHSSKSSLKNQHKGKVEKATKGSNAIKSLSKLERKNIARQLRDRKILDSQATRQLFEGTHGAEKIITIIPLTDDMSPADIAAKLVNVVKDVDDDDMIFDSPSVTSVKLARFKSNIKIIIPDLNDIISVLDATKVSDFVVFGLSATKEVEQEYGEHILRAVLAQGVASVIGVLPNVVSAYPKRNLQLDIRQSLLSFFSFFFPTEDKLYALENDQECLNCMRLMSSKLPKSITWRDQRGWLMAESIGYTNDLLCIEGTVRGVGFNSNRLVHLPGFGDFQVSHIEKLATRAKNDDGEALLASTDNRETLDELNPEELEMEDVEDMEDFESGLGARLDGHRYFDDSVPKRKVRVPKGTSEYQAKWYLEDAVGESEEEEEDDDEDNEMEEDEDVADMDIENDVDDDASENFEELTAEEEQNQLAEFRRKATDDQEFPDEIELYPGQSGRERLKRYRGIKSLANCNWDCDEFDTRSPNEWLRLLRINNYKATRNRITKQAIVEAEVFQGNKVRIYIRAPQFIMDRVNITKSPFVVYGLLEHEHKLAVCNFTMKSWEHFEEPIPAKDTIIVQYGPRRQVIQPLFSTLSNNKNNVHRSERFMQPQSMVMATAIAPVLFSNAPAIFFKQGQDGRIQFLAQGTFENCDHSRIIVKRSKLTGEPFKIHKRLVTVRYMFFNPEDINWYKAISLSTPSGRTGFIKESLGTHGYFKATFDGKLTAQDTIEMSLYKRVWPKGSMMWSN